MTVPRRSDFLLDIAMIGVYSLCMKRVNYHLTIPQIAGLKALSKKVDVTVAELIRKAVDMLLKKGNT